MGNLSSADIQKLLGYLNDELKEQSLEGEISLVGGAVMCLVFNARPSTKDVDAFFQPSKKIREAASRVAIQAGIKEDWLNDAVKGFLSDEGRFDSFLELSHLKIFVPRPDYLLAMKCLAMRIGEEFQDLNDVRYLLRYLNITKYEEAVKIITRYYPLERFPQKTLYALEGLLEELA
ncbi:MAG: hypothetical protein HY609_03470 [Deltaproteobacteria bacterium]|nr:hypothetical protein [Deltaproteobacteria bacterium]MBI4223969.1 hypothetical protein [Deltaproteobacteria bacterium]